MILAGDIGGTNTRLALAESIDNHIKFVKGTEKSYESKQYEKGLLKIIDIFLQDINCTPKNIEAIGIGVAGPMQETRSPEGDIERSVKLTNIHWPAFSEHDLREKFKLNREQVSLINDMEAIAYAIPELTDEDIVELNPQAKNKEFGNRALISAGTGLGELLLLQDKEHKGKYHLSPSEGGNTNFPPTNELEIELLQYYQKKFENGYVRVEDLVAGPGIARIYQFLKDHPDYPEADSKVEEALKKDESGHTHPPIISRYALETKDPLCDATLNLFALMYGNEVGNMVLKYLAFGGVYLGGGIAPKTLDYLKNGLFIEAMKNRGIFSDSLSDISVKVIKHKKVGLLGAARKALGKD